MTETSKNARIAGFLYLLLAFVGPVRLIYIPTKLIVTGDAAATAANIAANQGLFQFGILSDVLTGTLGLFTGLALYRLFKDVNKNLAILMVILGGLMVTPIYFLNSLNDCAALMFASGTDFLTVFDKPQRDAFAMLFLRLHHYGVVVNEVFWGLWLFPLGMLTIRSGFLPKFLGWWLILNGIAYVVESYVGLMLPQYEDTVSNYAFPVQFGEVAFLLWILIMGAKTPPAST
jgi:hypothetical protein